jgi:DNA-binding transcriptional LysR family regulator
MSQKRERGLDIKELRTFVEIADTGGVASAARSLGISKSIVSRRLGALEEALGIQLFNRTTRGATLTRAGATFRNHAAKVCAEIDAAREAILPASDLRGLLRIAAPLTFGPTHLSLIFAELAQHHPNLHVETCYTDRVVDIIAEGFDCAIRLGHLPDSNLIARRVGPFYSKLVASPAYIKAHGAPETPTEILTHQSLMQGTEQWQFTDDEKIVQVNPQGRFKADNGLALVDAALAGLGIANLPEGLVVAHIASGALVPIMSRYPPKPGGMFVVRPSSPYPSRKLRTLTEMLIACFSPNALTAPAQIRR